MFLEIFLSYGTIEVVPTNIFRIDGIMRGRKNRRKECEKYLEIVSCTKTRLYIGRKTGYTETEIRRKGKGNGTEGSGMEEVLKQIAERVEKCRKCGLAKTRQHPVTGGGNPFAKIMLIGEAPGEKEDLCGKAFVGKAGQLLDKMLWSIGLDRGKVYLANVVKCRPPRNRNPSEEEIACCLDHLRAQFLAVRPRLILLLGSVAAKALLDRNFSVLRGHGTLTERKGVIFLPTFHPALLRDESKKSAAWQDLRKAKEIIDREGLDAPRSPCEIQ